MKPLLAAILAFVLVGCVSVPETDITYSPGAAGKPPSVRIKAPKDVDIQGFELVRDGGTGQAILRIRSYRARVNPAVIEAQGAREVDLVNAVGTQAINGFKEGAAFFATGGASSLVGSSRPIGASRPVGSLTNAPVPPSP